MTVAEQATPPASPLLAFTLALGAGLAMMSPAWQSMITELLPREEFPG